MRVADAYVGWGKKATNVSVNESLLWDARALNLNLSATLERALAEEVRKAKWAQWREENRDAMAATTRMWRNMACSATVCASSDAAVPCLPDAPRSIPVC